MKVLPNGERPYSDKEILRDEKILSNYIAAGNQPAGIKDLSIDI